MSARAGPTPFRFTKIPQSCKQLKYIPEQCASMVSGRWPRLACAWFSCAGPDAKIGEKPELRRKRSAKIEGNLLRSGPSFFAIGRRGGRE